MTVIDACAQITYVTSTNESIIVQTAAIDFDLLSVQVLLDKGAEVNTSDEVTAVTPLMAASQCGHADVVMELLKAGANVNAGLKATGQSAVCGMRWKVLCCNQGTSGQVSK